MKFKSLHPDPDGDVARRVSTAGRSPAVKTFPVLHACIVCH